MKRWVSWGLTLAAAVTIWASSPGIAGEEKQPQPDPEIQKRALVAALDQAPYERALDHELVVEYETWGARTDVEVFLRRDGQWLGRPLRVRVEADGRVKVRQHGWAGRSLTRDPIHPSQRAGRAGFRALLPHLNLEGDFGLNFLAYPRTPRGVEEFLMILVPSPYSVRCLNLGPPWMIRIRPDGSTHPTTLTPLWLLHSLAPVGF